MKVTALQARTVVSLLALSLGLSSSRAMGQEPAPAEPSSPAIAAPQSPPADPAEIIRRVAAHEEENEKRFRNYTFRESDQENKLDGKGDVKSTEITASEVMMIYGEQVHRLIAKDGKPLPPEDAAKEEEKINKLLAKYKNESEDQRAKRLAKYEEEEEKKRSFVKEVADAFNLTMLQPETVDGHQLYVIQGEPKPGYHSHSDEGKFLTKFHGKIWIDPNAYQWVKLELETLDTISYGLFLARLHKGTRFFVEQTRVNDDVWLPKLLRLHLGVRVALLKDVNYDVTQTYSDYKKFGSQSRIVAMGDAEETPKN